MKQIICLMLLITGLVNAQVPRGHHPGSHFFFNMISQLELTEIQKWNTMLLIKKYRPQRKEIEKQIKDKIIPIRKNIWKGIADETELLTALQLIAPSKAKMMVLMSKFASEFRQILNSKQIKIMDKFINRQSENQWQLQNQNFNIMFGE